MVSYSLKEDNGPAHFHYYTEPDFKTILRQAIKNAREIVGFNLKFDLHWVANALGYYPDDVEIFDCSLAEFVQTGQEAVMVSLDDTLESYGLPLKTDKVKEYWSLGIDTPDIPIEVLEEYNNTDVDNTYLLYLAQKSLLNEKLTALVYLEGQDLLTLAAAERAGIAFDQKASEDKHKQYSLELANIKRSLLAALPELPEHVQFNWNSGDQLSALLYGGSLEFEWRTEEETIYKSGANKGQPYLKGTWHSYTAEFPQRFKPLPNTLLKKCTEPGYVGTLFYQTDDPTLKQLKSRKHEDRKLLELLAASAKHQKIIETIESYWKLFKTYEWEDNIVHGSYNQNIARTGRLSSSKPNMQNQDAVIDGLMVSRYENNSTR